MLASGFQLPLDRNGKPNYVKWWPAQKNRWAKWEDFALFVDVREPEKQKHMANTLLLPTVHRLLNSWWGASVNEAKPDHLDDQITCTNCISIGLRNPMKFKRCVLLAHVQKWQQEEMLRRGMGVDSQPETKFSCDFCQHGSTASDLLSTRATLESIPCPSCLSNNVHPPFSFSRPDALSKLHEQGPNATLQCTKEGTNLRLFDILVTNCFVSYADSRYLKLIHELTNNLHREDSRILFWPEMAQYTHGNAVAKLESTTHAIKKSSVVVILLSDGYFTSPDCIREFGSAVEHSKLLIPLIVEPFSFFKGQSVQKEGEKVPKWFQDDLPTRNEYGLVTHWSILEHFHPVDYRTSEVQTANADYILHEISSRFFAGTSKEKLDGKYSHWKSGLPDHARKVLQGARTEVVENHIRQVFAQLDVDQTGSLDLNELKLGMTMLGLKTDNTTELSSLMAEVCFYSHDRNFSNV